MRETNKKTMENYKNQRKFPLFLFFPFHSHSSPPFFCRNEMKLSNETNHNKVLDILLIKKKPKSLFIFDNDNDYDSAELYKQLLWNFQFHSNERTKKKERKKKVFYFYVLLNSK